MFLVSRRLWVTLSLTLSSESMECPDRPPTRCLHLNGRLTGDFQRNLQSQRYNRRKCAHLLRDLATTVDLPPHSAFFSLQLLDLAHRWSEREDNDIQIFDVLPLAARVHILVKMNPPRAPDPQQPARPLADLLTASARLLARRLPHNVPSLHTA